MHALTANRYVITAVLSDTHYYLSECLLFLSLFYSVRCFEVTVLDRETLKAPFAYVTWGMANPGKPQASMTHNDVMLLCR